MPDPATVRYELPATGIARIVLDRPERRNAQSRRMTYELNEAFDRAARDEETKVVILAAEGPDFCSGHDLADTTIGETFPFGRDLGRLPATGRRGVHGLRGNRSTYRCAGGGGTSRSRRSPRSRAMPSPAR